MNRLFVPRLVPPLLSSFLLAVLVSAPRDAHALDWGLKLEPGMAAAAGAPQSHFFGPGFGASLKGLIGLNRYLDAQAGITYVGLPARAPAPSRELGGAIAVGAGLRLKRPHDLARGYSPWLDVDLMYARTGERDRFAFSIGTGLSSALDADRRFWLGPFVRYFEVVQGHRLGADNTDAKIFIVGASLEFGSAHRRNEPIAIACPPCVIDQVSDRDGDGVADRMDMCPDAPGPAEHEGCPIYKKVVVRPDKLELREKILFSWDKAVIEPQSYALLDEVVQALKDNKSFRVRVEGHTDSSGPETHNQTLSEDRAHAVLDYLVAHGIPADRLGWKGFSSSQPMDRNDTEAGREANRRVEFVVELKIVNDRSAK